MGCLAWSLASWSCFGICCMSRNFYFAVNASTKYSLIFTFSSDIYLFYDAKQVEVSTCFYWPSPTISCGTHLFYSAKQVEG